MVILSEILFVAAASEQCELKDIHVVADEANSTFVYNFVYEDPSCINKEQRDVTLRSCDGLSNTIRYPAGFEGITIICREDGRWKVMVGNIESVCCNCSYGTHRKPDRAWGFSYKELRIEMKNVHPRVTGWNVAIYKATDPLDYLICNRHNLHHIKRQFRKTSLQPFTNQTTITLKHNFEEACYCFEMVPITHWPLWPKNEVFTTTDCKPTAASSEDGTAPTEDMFMAPRTWITLSVLVAIVALVVLVSHVIVGKPQFLSKLLGLKQLIVGQTKPSFEQMWSQGPGVLLLYALDVSGSEALEKLKTDLQDNFKIHDLFDRTDYKRLADPCGWVQEMLLPGSGMKLLLVESKGMMALIKSLLQSSSENFGMVTSAPTSCNLLNLALSTIICTGLRRDYSTVFVVRFSDEVENVADLMVQMKRYKFPDHFLMLKEAMREARCSSDGNKFV